MKHYLSFTLGIFMCQAFHFADALWSQDTKQPMVASDLVFAEKDGLVAVEAEHFIKQELTEVRAFHITTEGQTPKVSPDGDDSHVPGASGGAYIEVLPDTRRTHSDKLVQGESFSGVPGKLAVLTYKVHFSTTGRYYVWARAHSTGPEDNGLHVGIDGTWPETGQRLQWCEGKNQWRWESKQRTEKVHCGEPYLIYLDVEKPGLHDIHFSMREDGFELDKWLMTTKKEFVRPEDVGPSAVVHSGTPPKVFAFVAAKPQTAKPKESKPAGSNPEQTSVVDPNKLQILASQLFLDDTGYYLDKGKWLAVNPEKHKEGRIQTAFPYPSGRYDVTLVTVGESDGKSTYEVAVNDVKVGSFVCPLSKQTFEEGPAYNTTFKNVELNSGDVITMRSQIASEDGKEFSRARIARLEFAPADAATKELVAKRSASTPSASKPRVPQVLPRQPDGKGAMRVSGELKQWHKVTLDLDGPFAHEQDNEPNPFTDHALQVTFTHASGSPTYNVPGYFAADGNAGQSSAESGTKWRTHFAPDKTGEWKYRVSFQSGKNAAIMGGGKSLPPFDGLTGSFTIAASDESANDLRSKGRLAYVGKRYLQHLGSKEYFLKVGTDSPETLLAYSDFDNTEARKPNVPLKKYTPHLGDWKSGDPTWKGDKGKGLVGAMNYLASKGINSISFLTYNAAGDGDNIWPFVQRDDKMHWDCSKLDQWGIVLDHATAKGIYLHFKLQENEMDDNRRGQELASTEVKESLDGGRLGPERRLYCREIIARFGHALALNWNIGEENTQSTEEVRDMVRYLHETDPYKHNTVIHTFPAAQEKVYRPLLGDATLLTGASLQNSWSQAHQKTLFWIRESQKAGRPWVVAHDEQNPASDGVPADAGFQGNDGTATQNGKKYTMHDIRKLCLWGTLMAGGAGVEYYFGYKLPENDLKLEDFRSRDKSWDYCRIAHQFFASNKLPISDMECVDALIGNAQNDNSKYCLAKPSEVYLVYLPEGGTTNLNLADAKGDFSIDWFNPRVGGATVKGSIATVTGGKDVSLGNPPNDPSEDWLIVVRRK